MQPVFPDIGVCRTDQQPLLVGIHTFQSVAVGCRSTGLYFHDNQQAKSFGNQINFGVLKPPVTVEQPIIMESQVTGGSFLPARPRS